MDWTLVPLLAIVCAAARSDLRHLRIPNSHVLVVLALFVLTAPFLPGWSELGARLLAAAIAFAVGFVLFVLRLFGGGDVKMLPAILLMVPSDNQLVFLQLFAGSLLVTSLGALALQRLPAAQRLGWQSVRTAGHVPVGVAMAGAVALLALVRLGPL